MPSSPESFGAEDIELLRLAAAKLESEGDALAAWQLLEEVAAIDPTGDANDATRARTLKLAVPPLPSDVVLEFDPEAALQDIWDQLDPHTKSLLALAGETRAQLGALPRFARAIALHVAVAFENEIRLQSGIHDTEFSLGDIWRTMVTPDLFGRVRMIVTLRNRLVHPWDQSNRSFSTQDCNALLYLAGLLTLSQGSAFRDLKQDFVTFDY